jgi:hypothetical protein
MITKRNIERFGILLIVVVNFIFLFLSKSTYDDGDSIRHYLEAKAAFSHPGLFLNHWAKPVFVLLSAPFAQFGIIGIKLFNGLCVTGGIFFTWKIAQLRQIKHLWVLWLMALSAPHIFMIQSSGLTEPLFALIIIASAFLYLKDKHYWSVILFSFLPFVRSEGWVLALVILCLLIWQKKWKVLPFLALGTVVYGIIGLFYYHDFLWMFHMNPYSGTEVKYGTGDFFHYIKQLPYLFGWPNLFLFVLGLYFLAKQTIKTRFRFTSYHFLVPGLFLAMLLSHSIFWHKGWFHSFGMTRVILAVFPMFILIAFDGLQMLLSMPKALQVKRSILVFFALLITWFPYSGNKAGFDIPDDFHLNARQEAALEANNWYREHYPNKPMIGLSYYYLLEAFDIQLYDTKRYNTLMNPTDLVAKKGNLVFWDDYFSESEMGVSLSTFQNENYTPVKIIEKHKFNRSATIHIFERK